MYYSKDRDPNSKNFKVSKSVIYHTYFEFLKKSNLKFENQLRKNITEKIKWLLSDIFDISDFTPPSMCLTKPNSNLMVGFQAYHLQIPTSEVIGSSWSLSYYIETQCIAPVEDIWEDVSSDIPGFINYMNKSVTEILKREGFDNVEAKSNFFPQNQRQNKIYIYFIKKDVDIVNIMSDSSVEVYNELLKLNPNLINNLGAVFNDKTIYKFMVKFPKTKDILSPEMKLIWDKYDKEKVDPERRNMEKRSDMYVFIARPKFIEIGGGNYKKDLEIENMVKIDPYDVKQLKILGMMKLRARTQSNDSELYCIWIEKDAMSEEELRDINSEEMSMIRSIINQRKEKIG
jgi:hypothetical protein